ncbi:MAG: hypothetical protein NC898_06855 [Candidatus Omnitrophica bacterium]|nr:hypothetical protein [Candidatus Omnitrophota bacterium]MCM8794152.1 hypothetical protein [Candidatus Omnitrophota bacterium]
MGIKINKGFSIVELGVSIIIVSIFVLISLPVFKETISSLQFENLAQRIVSFLRYAQELAVTQNKPYKLEVYKDEKRLFLVTDEKTQRGKELIIPRDYTFSTEILILVFNPVGGIEILNKEMDPLKGTLLKGAFKLKDKRGREAGIELWSYAGNVIYKRKK